MSEQNKRHQIINDAEKEYQDRMHGTSEKKQKEWSGESQEYKDSVQHENFRGGHDGQSHGKDTDAPSRNAGKKVEGQGTECHQFINDAEREYQDQMHRIPDKEQERWSGESRGEENAEHHEDFRSAHSESSYRRDADGTSYRNGDIHNDSGSSHDSSGTVSSEDYAHGFKYMRDSRYEKLAMQAARVLYDTGTGGTEINKGMRTIYDYSDATIMIALDAAKEAAGIRMKEAGYEPAITAMQNAGMKPENIDKKQFIPAINQKLRKIGYEIPKTANCKHLAEIYQMIMKDTNDPVVKELVSAAATLNKARLLENARPVRRISRLIGRITRRYLGKTAAGKGLIIMFQSSVIVRAAIRSGQRMIRYMKKKDIIASKQAAKDAAEKAAEEAVKAAAEKAAAEKIAENASKKTAGKAAAEKVERMAGSGVQDALGKTAGKAKAVRTVEAETAKKAATKPSLAKTGKKGAKGKGPASRIFRKKTGKAAGKTTGKLLGRLLKHPLLALKAMPPALGWLGVAGIVIPILIVVMVVVVLVGVLGFFDLNREQEKTELILNTVKECYHEDEDKLQMWKDATTDGFTIRYIDMRDSAAYRAQIGDSCIDETTNSAEIVAMTYAYFNNDLKNIEDSQIKAYARQLYRASHVLTPHIEVWTEYIDTGEVDGETGEPVYNAVRHIRNNVEYTTYYFPYMFDLRLSNTWAGSIEGLPSWITEDMVNAALEVQAETGYPVSVCLGQAICENGSAGPSQLGIQQNNCLGIKAHTCPYTTGSGNWGTEEDYGGGSVGVTANFASYASYEDCIRCWANTVGRYTPVQVLAGFTPEGEVCDAYAFLVAVKAGGYATSATYVDTVWRIIESYNLTRFDSIGSHSEQRQKIVDAAYSQLGVPYVWGGTTPGVGFDCSGLVQYCYAVAGIRIPRTDEYQRRSGTVTDNPQPGDICWSITSAGTGHVGIYIGDGMMIEAKGRGIPVCISPVRVTEYITYIDD